MSKITVVIDHKIRQCDCCGKTRLKRTLKINKPKLHLGVTCAGQWFSLNLSGNPYMAAERLEAHLNSLDENTIMDIIEQIKEESDQWII